MTLNGLKPVTEFTPRIGDIDVKDEVDETVAMLKYLSIVGDEDEIRNELTGDYQALKGTFGVEGRLHVPPSIDVIPRAELLRAVKYILGGLDSLVVEGSLWTPADGKEEGYTSAQLEESAPTTQAAMALHSSAHVSNPLLHFTNQPFDRKDEGDSQLRSLASLQERFQVEHPDRTIKPLSNTAILGMVIEDVIAGRKSLPLDRFTMRDASLPLVTLGASPRPIIGVVSSYNGTVSLRGGLEYLSRHPHTGIGISMGLKETPES